MQKPLKRKSNTEKWKKLFDMINEVTEKDTLSFNDLKEIFSVGYEWYKRKKPIMGLKRTIEKKRINEKEGSK